MITEMLASMAKFTPKTGFNLVGVDEYEEPGEELYLIGHYETRAEAEAALAARKKANPTETVHIYEP